MRALISKILKLQALGLGKSLQCFVKVSINSTNMFQTKEFGCQTMFIISISSYQVKISGLYPSLHGLTALNKIAEILIKRLIIIVIKTEVVNKRKLLMRFTRNLKFVKFRMYGNLWEKKESSGMIFIFDPQCHTLVTFFLNLPICNETNCTTCLKA